LIHFYKRLLFTNIVMSEVIPGTVCCLLCRGLVIYKHGDKSRFNSHMNNEHGAFFDIDYLLASSLMDVEQKAMVANTVRGNNYKEMRVETSSTVLGQAREVPEVPAMVAGVNSRFTHGFKKETMKQCGENIEKFSSSDIHAETNQDHMENIKQEAVDQIFETQAGAFDDKVYKEIANRDELSDEEFLKEIKADRLKSGSFANGDEEMRAHDVSRFSVNNLQSMDESQETSPSKYGNGATEIKKHELDNDIQPTKRQKKMNKHNIEGDVPLSDVPVDQNYPSFGVSNSVGLDASANDADGVGKPQKEFVCSFPPCTKSFSNKSSISVHERKFHDRPALKKGRRSKKEIEASNIDSSPSESLLQQGQDSRADLQETFPSEMNYPRFPDFPDPESLRKNIQSIEKDFKTEQEPESMASSSSFLTDTSLGFEGVPNPGPEEENLSQTDASADMTDFDKNDEDQEQIDSRKPAIDISNSKYFKKNPNVIANARGKSVKLFDEVAHDLPEGWRMRSIEVNSKTGSGVSTIKHYLSPDTKVLKTGLSVIEYLRLEGRISTDQILAIAEKLNVSEKKIRNLYDI